MQSRAHNLFGTSKICCAVAPRASGKIAGLWTGNISFMDPATAELDQLHIIRENIYAR